MFKSTRLMTRAFTLATCLALALPAACLRADDQSDRAEQERIAAEQRQREIDADQQRQRQAADEWRRQRAEAEQCAADERQREIDADRVRQQQLNDE